MVTCETAEALVVRETDGLLAPAEVAGLEAHAAVCQACRKLREANLAVTRTMALRTDAPVPSGFASRVLARVAPAHSTEWLDAVDWRRWTGWMLPVAAGLLVIAAVAGIGVSTSTPTAQQTSGESSAAALDAWTWSGDAEASVAISALRRDLTSDDLLAAMLGTRVTDAGGTGNER
jgi:predicted anti-sigma-YlaC factor YlaD